MSRGFAVVLMLVVLAVALFAAWVSTRQTDYFPTRLQSTFNDCTWPGGASREPVLADFLDEGFSVSLSDFREPSLYRRAADAPRSVRFTWLRSFHEAIVVRADSLGDGRWRLTAKRRSAGGGFGPDEMADGPVEVQRYLTAAEIEDLTATVVSSRLFEAPSKGCPGGVDGAEWLFEGADPIAGYRLHHLWSPRTEPERELGVFMLGLTGWDIEPVY